MAAVDEAAESVTAAGDPRFWLGFGQVPFIGPARIQRLLERFGDLEIAWNAPIAALRAVLDERSLESLVRTRATLDLDREWKRVADLGVSIVSRADQAYPRLLGEIPAPPPLLYVKGELTPADDLAVALVGTLRATSTGREVAGRIAGELAAAGVTIVSGLARGIDGAAHQSALRAGGRTIAVLGCGVDVVYPPEHRRLAEQIAENGALLSDYPPGTPPDAPNFPARNRIISGLSLGVVVVEAPARSGALITVDFAADQGREVFVVPGSVLAAANAGSNRLMRDGARPVTCAEDVLEDLNIGRRREQVAVQQALPLEDGERRLIALLSGEPVHIDEVAAAANVPIHEAAALLLTLELKGLVRNAGAQHYARV